MKNQRKSQSPFRTTQSIMRDSPNTQLDESSISTNRIPQNRESTRARMKINQSHNNALAQGGQIRKQIANERASANGGNPNEFNPKKFVTKDLKESDIIDIKQVFDYYDSEQAGILSPNDLEQLLSSCGYHPTKETLYGIKIVSLPFRDFSELDEDELGGITFEYFLGILNQDKSKSERKDTIRRVYRKYDKNNKGFITLQDLRQVVYKDLKEEIDEEVLAEVILSNKRRSLKTDSNQDGKMTFEDFYNVMTKRLHIQLQCLALQSQRKGPKEHSQLIFKIKGIYQNYNWLNQEHSHATTKTILQKLQKYFFQNQFNNTKGNLKTCHQRFPFQKIVKLQESNTIEGIKNDRKSTNKKTVQKPSLDFSLSGFQMMDIEREDCFLQSYVRKQ